MFRKTVLPILVALAIAACGGSATSTTTSTVIAAAAETTTAGGDGVYPVVVEAANGRVEISARPAAIVSLSPTATEMLFAVGAGDQTELAGRIADAWALHASESPNSTLSQSNLIRTAM